MEIVETWYFQIWVNFGGTPVNRLSSLINCHKMTLLSLVLIQFRPSKLP